MRYGTRICHTCYGYGLKLTEQEKTRISLLLATKGDLSEFAIARQENDAERCADCAGMGWVFVAGHPHIYLPRRTVKRWDSEQS
jgi:LmbE family N-acetylglucosaminyl deacetylase